MHPKHQEVINLRMKGISYGDIARTSGVSKNSVSRWCKNLELPLAIQKIVEAKTKASHRQLKVYNEQRHRAVQFENRQIRKDSTDQIHPLSDYELLLVGAALYWGEGYKKKPPSGSPRVAFVNSDPKMITLFLHFLRRILYIPEERILATVRIYPSINKESAIKFWSRVAGIPQKRFHITHQISRASKGKRPNNSLPYGTLALVINSRQNFFRIKGWIDGLIKQNNLK